MSPLGALLGRPGGVLGGSWGGPGGVLGRSWRGPGGFLGVLLGALKLSQHKMLLNASWKRLGAVLEPSWGRLGGRLGASWGLLGPLGAVLRPLGALSEPCWGHLGRLETQSDEVAKTYKHHWFLQGLGALRGSKMGPSWAKLALSCDLQPS